MALEDLTKLKDKNDIFFVPYLYVWNKIKNRWDNPIEHIDCINYSDKPQVIYDNKLKKPLAYIWIKEDNNIKAYNFFCTKYCMSHRKRPDGLIGFQSVSGLDTRLSDHKLDNKEVEKLSERIQKDKIDISVYKQAHWNEPQSKFIIRSINGK